MKATPRALFFTGGTALASLSRKLSKKNLPSIHIVSTFDSGGSTAELRRVYAIPAVGDLRNRLLALASPDIPETVLSFCSRRLEMGNPVELREKLRDLGKKQAPVWWDMPDLFAKTIRRYLHCFLERMSPAFDPQGACLGNLLLAGCYLEHHRNFEPVMSNFRKLLQCRGIVAPTVEGSYYLGAVLANGTVIVGQHLFSKLPAPVKRIFLTVNADVAKLTPGFPECHPPLASMADHYIRHANAICFPMGSFFSSVLANLLPKGVGRAVADNGCIKIFIPNSGHDPELADLDIASQAAMILSTLKADAPAARNEDLLNLVLVDGKNGRYPGGLGKNVQTRLREMGLRPIDVPMVFPDNPRAHDPEAIVKVLRQLLTYES